MNQLWRVANFRRLRTLRLPRQMPTYEYRCPDGHDFEKFTQRMSSAQSELPCPSCGMLAERRLSAGGGFLFKGSGFYITDYGKDGKKDQRTAESKSDGAKSDGAKSDGAKSDGAKSDGVKSDGASSSASPAAPAKPSTSAAAVPSSAPATPKSGPDK